MLSLSDSLKFIFLPISSGDIDSLLITGSTKVAENKTDFLLSFLFRKVRHKQESFNDTD